MDKFTDVFTLVFDDSRCVWLPYWSIELARVRRAQQRADRIFFGWSDKDFTGE